MNVSISQIERENTFITEWLKKVLIIINDKITHICMKRKTVTVSIGGLNI